MNKGSKTAMYYVLILLLTFMLLNMIPAMAENTNIAQVIPTTVIPLMKTPPVIDGVIADGEWQTLHISHFVSQQGDLLQAKPGEFWVGSDGKMLYIAVRSAVHPQLGAIAKYPPCGNADVGDVVYDDSIELWIDNNPDGTSGQYYQIMVNSLGATYDASFERKDKIAQKFWRCTMTQAHKVANGVWTAEFAIDLASLNITDITAPLAMRVCRNFKYPWDQSRWAPLVRSFDSPETMPRVRFSATAPLVNELGMQDANGINVALALTNPTASPIPVKVKLGYNAQDQPRYYQNWDVTLAPSAAQTFAYQKPFFTAGNYPAVGEMLVTDANGAVLYHRDFKWNTQPGKLWDAMETANAQDATEFAIAYNPSYQVLRWKTTFSTLKNRQQVTAIRMIIINAITKAVIKVSKVKATKDFSTEQTVTLPKLAPGKYEAQLFLDGKTPATTPVKTAPFVFANDFPWLNNKLGISDVVIPPFTPLVVNNNVVKSILREHTMGNTGLWDQVRSLDEPVLSGPMRFEVRQSGKLLTPTGKLSFSTKKPNNVIADAHWQAGSIIGHTSSSFDYDGCMKVTLELSQRDKMIVDGLDLLIPLSDAVTPLMHACGEGLRSNYGGNIPAGTGEVWSSAKGSRDKLLGTFLPYLWVGGPERGLVWFASNDRDWVVDTTDKVSALSLERNNGVLLLRVRLIQKPTTLQRTHKIVFGVQATPVKPMPADPDWRLRGFMSGGRFDTVVLGMCMYWGSDIYGIFPRNRDFTVVQKIAAAKKEGKTDTAFFDAYTKANPDIRAEIMWSANPGKEQAVIPYTNVRGEFLNMAEWPVYQDEWQRFSYSDRVAAPSKTPYDFVITPVRSRQDFLLYYYQQFLKNGFDGIYWDNICIYDNENPVTGKGYVREDGLFQTDTDIWELRELTKRTAVMMYQMGKRNLTMPHMTNAYLIPVFSWTTINLDWEWRYGGLDFQDRFTRDYTQAASLGRQGGNMPVILQGITEVTDPEKIKWVERTRIAVCMVHNLDIWQADSLYVQLRQYLYNMGYGTAACTEYHYWDKQPVATITGMDAAYIVYNGKDRVVVFIADYGNGGTPTITLDTKKLGLPDNYTTVNWENANEKSLANTGTVILPAMKKHDFRMLVIEK